MLDDTVICSSEGFIKIEDKRFSFNNLIKSQRKLAKFFNTSEGMGYMTVNHKGGKIIVLDEKAMFGMRFSKEYLLAHTGNVLLKDCK